MSKTTLSIAIILTVIAVALFAKAYFKKTPTEARGYSADIQVTDYKDPGKSYTCKLFVRWGKGLSGMRREETFANRKRILLSITSSNQTWVLDPEHWTYWIPKVEARLTVRSMPPGGPRLVDIPEGGAFLSLGTKLIAGRSANGFEITEPASNEQVKWTIWEDATLGIALLMDKPGITRSEITHVSEAVPAEELFRLPDGYTKIDRPTQ